MNFKNLKDPNYIKKNLNYDAQKHLRDIYSDSNTGPFIDSDIAFLLESILKDIRNYNDEDLRSTIENLTFHLGKGNVDEIFIILRTPI